MQKKIVALAVAGLSTAAFAQTNVTIYGVADVSAQGFNVSQSKGRDKPIGTEGNVFAMQSNSSLLGFKGTEDLGNGLKALFQVETGVNMTGGAAISANNGSTWSALRDTFVGLNSKYGTGMGGYVSTPFRSSLVSFDVMPGATGSSQIDRLMGGMAFGNRMSTQGSTSAISYNSSIRANAIAYAMPTLYGFDASIAYTGSGNDGRTNTTAYTGGGSDLSAVTALPQSAWGFNLGWTGYGVNVKGAFQQANYNPRGANINASNLGDFTSYLVGAIYTGLPGLKASVVYNRNSLGTNGTSLITTGAGKISNNSLYAGVSYRLGNWEPRLSAAWVGDNDGANSIGQQNGARQWTLNTGYYLSKRTQVYGLISNLNNSANANYSFGQQVNNLKPTGGENAFTYGMGMRTTF